MRYFLDTEFIERGPDHPIELISLALVAEDGREFYRVSYGFKVAHASKWVQENVINHLPHPVDSIPIWDHNHRIARKVLEFVGDDPTPEFWGYYAAYDWVVFCQLFGDMGNLPSPFPYYCRDLKQLIDERGLEISQDDSVHDALGDARWVRDTFDRIARAS